MLRALLAAEGSKIGRRHVKTLMKRMEIEASVARIERKRNPGLLAADLAAPRIGLPLNTGCRAAMSAEDR
jgi:hypothetical protein